MNILPESNQHRTRLNLWWWFAFLAWQYLQQLELQVQCRSCHGVAKKQARLFQQNSLQMGVLVVFHCIWQIPHHSSPERTLLLSPSRFSSIYKAPSDILFERQLYIPEIISALQSESMAVLKMFINPSSKFAKSTSLMIVPNCVAFGGICKNLIALISTLPSRSETSLTPPFLSECSKFWSLY